MSDITQTITPIPEAGHRGVDVRDAFVTKQEAFQDALQGVTVAEMNNFSSQANALALGVNNDKDAAALSKTNAQLAQWESEARQLTAASYSSEAEDVEVKHYSSDGDGTFTPSTQAGVYSTLHHDAKALVSRNSASTFAGNSAASASASELYKWEAQAWKLTAQSNANEAEDTFTNLVTSDGDGTFTYTPTTEYSATHHRNKAEAFAISINPDGFMEQDGTVRTVDADTMQDSGSFMLHSDSTNTPHLGYGTLLVFGSENGQSTQIYSNYADGGLWTRSWDNVDWSTWKDITGSLDATDYATDTIGGTAKMKLVGADFYLNFNGTDIA